MSKLRDYLRRVILDPIAGRIESRIEHYRSMRPTTHQGERWRAIADIGTNVTFYPEARLENRGLRQNLRISNFCHIRGEISVMERGTFSMGSHSFVGPGTRIWCAKEVSVGSHVLISHLVDIHDSSSHSLDWRQRREESTDLFEFGCDAARPDVKERSVIIEDDVWIGLKSTILTGVRLGRGAVVAAASVVTRDVPDFTLVAGNPARVIRELPRGQ